MDTAAIHDLAARLRRTSLDLQDEVDALLHRVEAVPWHGRAAEAMRVAVHAQLADLARAARRHDDAADALLAHAARVEEITPLLPALGGLAGAWWAA